MVNDLKKLLGKRAAAARKARKLTQQQLADRIGRTWETVSNFERGVSLPSLETMLALTTELGVTVSELFEDVENPPNPRRGQKEARLRALIKVLPDAELDVVLTQIEALAKR